jgi:peptidoglycan-N-acetylglucosamine deacetylase
MSGLQMCWTAVTALTIVFLIVAAISALPKMKVLYTGGIAAIFVIASGITAFGSIAPLMSATAAGFASGHAAAPLKLPPPPASGAPLANDASAGRVVFTFDDGPDKNTPGVIAELNELHLHGVFFVIGDKVVAHRQIVAAEVANGEVIGNHTWDHKSLTGKGTGTRPLSQAQVRAELARADAAIVTAGAPEPSLWRPPYGGVNAAYNATAQVLGLRVVLDSGTNIVDSNDWAGLSPQQIAARVEPRLRDRTIVAFHDGLPGGAQTVRALPLIVAWMNAHHLGATTAVRPDATGGVVPYPGTHPAGGTHPADGTTLPPLPATPTGARTAPGTTAPAPAPSTRTPAPAAGTTTPAPAPSTTSPAPAPSTTAPAPNPTASTPASATTSPPPAPTGGQ